MRSFPRRKNLIHAGRLSTLGVVMTATPEDLTEQFSLLKNAPDQGMCAVKRYEFTTGSGKRVK